jgi:hypothetical protein
MSQLNPYFNLGNQKLPVFLQSNTTKMQNRRLMHPGSIIIGFIFLLISSCGSETPNTEMPEEETERDTVVFLPRELMGPLESDKINEASGLASSIRYPDRFWTHNDSRDGALIFLINGEGKTEATVFVKNVANRDWEDISVAYNAELKKNLIYIADIGDNAAIYRYASVYIMEEPQVNPGDVVEVNAEKVVHFTYEDGKRDAETIMVDPTTSDIYLVSKRETQVGLYTISYPYAGADTIRALKKLTLPYTQIVAGDISAKGDQIVLKNYTTVYYWKRKTGQTVADALSASPFLTPYIQEPQGEAIAWSRDGNAFFTLSEKGPFNFKPALYRYRKKL